MHVSPVLKISPVTRGLCWL
ncbi:hypothetical protein MAR_034513 [Mya arenaria]|uniref:Uncharacterized protein n=1 Tax=Mya arenaria TaxID=6604 RepID=A0ABY7GFU5_MYAAR|nr:hypothetical protein MAR_034513 [Mya arenaria]